MLNIDKSVQECDATMVIKDTSPGTKKSNGGLSGKLRARKKTASAAFSL